MRQASSYVVLDAQALAAGTHTGTPIHLNDAYALRLFVGYKLVMGATNFVGSLVFAGNVEDDGDYANWPALNVGALIAVGSDKITMTAGALAFATGMSAGTQRGLVRIDSPPPVIVPRFTYTSGGGTYSLKLKAVY